MVKKTDYSDSMKTMPMQKKALANLRLLSDLNNMTLLVSQYGEVYYVERSTPRLIPLNI